MRDINVWLFCCERCDTAADLLHFNQSIASKLYRIASRTTEAEVPPLNHRAGARPRRRWEFISADIKIRLRKSLISALMLNIRANAEQNTRWALQSMCNPKPKARTFGATNRRRSRSTWNVQSSLEKIEFKNSLCWLAGARMYFYFGFGSPSRPAPR